MIANLRESSTESQPFGCCFFLTLTCLEKCHEFNPCNVFTYYLPFFKRVSNLFCVNLMLKNPLINFCTVTFAYLFCEFFIYFFIYGEKRRIEVIYAQYYTTCMLISVLEMVDILYFDSIFVKWSIVDHM